MNKYCVDLTEVVSTTYRTVIEAENEKLAKEIADDNFFGYDYDIKYDEILERNYDIKEIIEEKLMKYEKYKCYAFINKITWGGRNHGYANGYVIVPKNHPFYGKDYNEDIKITNINDVKEYASDNFLGLFMYSLTENNKDTFPLHLLVPVHGGITFSYNYKKKDSYEFLTEEPNELDDYWMFGFDTLHCDDNETNWNKENCIKETFKFLSFLENVDNFDYIVKEI